MVFGIIAAVVAAAAGAAIGGALLGGKKTLAENVTEVTAELSASVINKTIIDASSVVNVGSIVRADKCEFKNNVIKQEIVVEVSQSSINKAFNSTEVKQDIGIIIDQIAEAVATNISLNPGSQEAKNVAQMGAKVKTEILNETLTNCSTLVSNLNEVDCKDSTFTGNVISQGSIFKIVKNCIQQAINTQNIEESLKIDVKNKAKAEEKNALAWLALIIGIVIVIIVGFFMTGKTLIKSITNWRFIAALTPLVIFIVYLVIANMTNRWPFSTDLITENPNLEKFLVSESTAVAPYKVFEDVYANEYDSIAYVVKEMEVAPEQGGEKIFQKLRTYDITTPATAFELILRLKPSPLVVCKEGDIQCPNTESDKACCSSLSNCDKKTGFCS